jgi:hypothetical protein
LEIQPVTVRRAPTDAFREFEKQKIFNFFSLPSLVGREGICRRKICHVAGCTTSAHQSVCSWRMLIDKNCGACVLTRAEILIAYV